MYRPKHFEPPSADDLEAAIRSHPLATLVRMTPDGLAADEIPLMQVSGAAGTLLHGHVARANPLWQDADGQPVLAVFRGPQYYVSPSWYPSKREHGKVVPTWNYIVVHVHGTLRAIEDRAWLRRLVGQLTDRHESLRAEPWAVDDAPQTYIDTMLGAIVGIEVDVARIEGKWKMSQNRSAADREGVARGLQAEGGASSKAGAAPTQD